MDPRKIIGVAEKLRESSEPEHVRSAISRAYYAAFNVAVNLLTQMGSRRQRNESHSVLHNRLLATNDTVLQSVGSKLGYLHILRMTADYDMIDKAIEAEEQADAAILQAKMLIADLDACVPDSDRWNLAKAALKRARK